MAEEYSRELQLLPTSSSSQLSGQAYSSSGNGQNTAMASPCDSINLQLSISLQPPQPPDSIAADSSENLLEYKDLQTYIEVLKKHAAEQIRLAAAEKAHAERVRELTRREMEMAESEFQRAKHMWDRARDEAERAERMKENATRRVDPACMEITCQSCHKRFRS